MNNYGIGISPSAGAGINSYADHQVIERCTFVNNLSNYGTGVYLHGDSNRVVNCLFRDNTATKLQSGSRVGDYGDFAAGLYACPGSTFWEWTRSPELPTAHSPETPPGKL